MKDMKLNVGFFVTVSGRWPREVPLQRKKEFEKFLKSNFQNINVVTADMLVVEHDDTVKTIEKFRIADVDILINVIGAFAGDTAVVTVAEKLNLPVAVWAPEDSPLDGGRLITNCLVAGTMNVAALKKLEMPCSFLFGDLKRNQKELETMFKVYLTKKKLNNTFLGLFGYRPTGFYNSIFSEDLIRKQFGVVMEHVDLSHLITAGNKIDQKLIDEDGKKITKDLKVVDLPEGHLANHSRLYQAIKEVIKEKQFDAASLKCWPELGDFHYTPCAVLSRFADEGFVIGCEGDVDATLTMLVHKYLTNDIPFMCDMIRIDEKNNTGLFWHCGQAAQKLRNPKEEVIMTNHSLAGEGCVIEEILKPGPVTVARVTYTPDGYKLFLLEGEAIPTKKNIRGTQVNVKFQVPAINVVKTLTDYGIPHHYSIIWHHVKDEMLELCKILDMEPVLVK
jgi:L-fucose isomerase-like protein